MNKLIEQFPYDARRERKQKVEDPYGPDQPGMKRSIFLKIWCALMLAVLAVVGFFKLTELFSKEGDWNTW